MSDAVSLREHMIYHAGRLGVDPETLCRASYAKVKAEDISGMSWNQLVEFWADK